MKNKKPIIIFTVAIILTLWIVCPFVFGVVSQGDPWDNTLPADLQLWNSAALSIRNNNDALEAALGVDLRAMPITYVNVKSPTYGALGDDDGAGGGTDDVNAIQAAVDAATKGDTIYFPNGTYRIRQGLTSNKRLNWLGESAYGVEIYIDIDTNTDGLTIDGTSISTQHTTIKNISFISNNACRAAIKFSETHRSYLENVWVRTNGSDEGFDFEDTLNLTIVHCGSEADASTNSRLYGSPDRTFWFHEGGANIGPNANVLINPIVYGSSAGHYAINVTVTGSSNEGNMTIIGGNVENTTGSGIYLEKVLDFRLIGTHIESIGGTYGLYVKDSRFCVFDLFLASEDGFFENVDYSSIRGLAGNFTFDSASQGNRIGNLDIGGNLALIDNGVGNVIVGNLRNSASSVYEDVGGPIVPLTDGVNLFTNSDILLWDGGTSSVEAKPFGFTEKSSVVLTKESTIVKFGRFSCKVLADTQA
ncbi:hypothetical protein LCGC14_1851780, partial [marine sediment metagenome]